MKENPIPVREQLILENKAMARYAAGSGLKIPNNLLTPLEEDDGKNTPSISQLVHIHNQLTHIVAPARPETVYLMDKYHNTKSFWRFMGPIPSLRIVSFVSVLFLVAFIGLSLFPNVNAETINQSLFDSSGEDLLLNLLFILSAAGMGSAFAILFKIQSFISDGTYNPQDESSYIINLILGLFAGVILSELIPISQDSHQLMKPLIALLGGFSSSMVYRILNRLVGNLEALFKGEEKDALNAERKAMRSDYDKRNFDEKTKSLHALSRLEVKLAGGASGDDLQQTIDNLRQALAPEHAHEMNTQTETQEDTGSEQPGDEQEEE